MKKITDYDDIVDRYIENKLLKHKNTLDTRDEFIVSSLKGFENKKGLDVGCANGQEILLLNKKKFKNIIGVEPSKKIIERKPGGITIKQGSWEKLPFENSSFDYMYSKFALQYSSNLKKAYSEAKRVLKKNGLLVFTIPNPYFAWERKIVGKKSYIINVQLFSSDLKVSYNDYCLSEYLSKDFLSKFDLKEIKEFKDKNQVKSLGIVAIKK